jgi:UDP-N-acetyl-D-glucosamine dehydrogenase
MWTRFIELAGEINTQMPRYVVSRLVEALNEDSKSLKGARVLVLGLAYKANIDDTRESPSFELIELLEEGGARVDYCDPYLPEALRTRKYDLGLKSVPCTREAFAEFDAVLVATAHDQFKDPRLWGGVKLVVDTRNMVEPLFGEGVAGGPKRLVKA